MSNLSAHGVDPRLLEILNAAATSGLGPGYTVQVTPHGGVRSKPFLRGSLHATGRAVDVQIYDPNGSPVPNYQSPKSFGIYEELAKAAREYQTKTYPELSKQFAWGGYFSGELGKKYGAMDLMHFSLGEHPAGGSWERGLDPKWARIWGVGEKHQSGHKAGKPFYFGDSIAGLLHGTQGGSGHSKNDLAGFTKIGASPREILRNLSKLSEEQIARMTRNGVVLSSGTNNPSDIESTIETIRGLIDMGVPGNRVTVTNINNRVEGASQFNSELSQEIAGLGVRLADISQTNSDQYGHPAISEYRQAVSGPTTPQPGSFGLDLTLSTPEHEQPADWSLSPPMATFGDNEFALAPNRFFDPVTGQITEGGNYTPQMDWGNLPDNSPLLASLLPTGNELPAPDLPGLHLDPEQNVFSGLPTGTPSQLPNEGLPGVKFSNNDFNIQPSQNTYNQPSYDLGSTSRDYQPFYDFTPNSQSESNVSGFDWSPDFGSPINTDFGALYGNDQYGQQQPQYSPQGESDTGLSDFGDYQWGQQQQSGFDTSIEWGEGLPSSDLLNQAPINYGEQPAAEPNDATYQFANQSPTWEEIQRILDDVNNQQQSEIDRMTSPIVGSATDYNLGQIVSGYGPTQQTPYSGFSGFHPYSGGSLFGSGGSITGFGHDAGGGTYGSVALGRGFGGPSNFGMWADSMLGGPMPRLTGLQHAEQLQNRWA